MIGIAFAILLALATGFMPAQARADVAGTASVIDGDTIEIEGQKIRLHGIDAPESEQTCVAANQWRCGQQATRALDKKIGGRPVTCAERDRGPDGLIVAVCRVGGEDLSAWLAAAGWALAVRQSSTDYEDEEQKARAARRGVWRGSILAPWDWRVSQQAKARASQQTAGARAPAQRPAARDAKAGPATFTIRAAGSGHFHVDAVAQGRSFPVIVDTGATVVSLSRRDAERIGINLNQLQYTHRMQTANGVTKVAPVTLRELSIGPITVIDVKAVVSDGKFEQSLLGMSFLNRLQSYTVSGNTLTLTALP